MPPANPHDTIRTRAFIAPLLINRQPNTVPLTLPLQVTTLETNFAHTLLSLKNEWRLLGSPCCLCVRVSIYSFLISESRSSGARKGC